MAVLVLTHETVSAQNPAAQTQQRGGTRLWYQAYDDGVRAIRAMNWQVAIDALQAALKLRPQQSRRVAFSGSRVDAYIPDYYLGVAFLNLKRFAEADAAFDRVRQANLVVAADAQYRELQTQASSAKFEASLARADGFIKEGDATRARQELASAEKLGVDPARIGATQGRIDQLAKVNPPVPIEPQPEDQILVPNLVGRTAQAASELLGTAGLRIGKVEQRAAKAPLNSVIDQSVPSGTRVARGSIVDLIVASAEAIAGPTAPPPAANPPGPSPNAPGGRGRGAAPLPPLSSALDERRAISAFYSGNYGAAAQALGAIVTSAEAPNPRSPRPSPRARFYLALSLAAMVITGDVDKSEMANAQRYFNSAGAIDQFDSDRRLVSPRILAMLGVRQ